MLLSHKTTLFPVLLFVTLFGGACSHPPCTECPSTPRSNPIVAPNHGLQARLRLCESQHGEANRQVKKSRTELARVKSKLKSEQKKRGALLQMILEMKNKNKSLKKDLGGFMTRLEITRTKVMYGSNAPPGGASTALYETISLVRRGNNRYYVRCRLYRNHGNLGPVNKKFPLKSITKKEYDKIYSEVKRARKRCRNYRGRLKKGTYVYDAKLDGKRIVDTCPRRMARMKKANSLISKCGGDFSIKITKIIRGNSTAEKSKRPKVLVLRYGFFAPKQRLKLRAFQSRAAYSIKTCIYKLWLQGKLKAPFKTNVRLTLLGKSVKKLSISPIISGPFRNCIRGKIKTLSTRFNLKKMMTMRLGVQVKTQ